MRVEERFELVKGSKTFKNILDAYGLRDKTVLDLGCGFGEHLVHFGPDSMGITSNPDEVEYASSKNINVIKGNIEFIDELEIGQKFDAIWANNVFEHILSPHAFLIKLKKLVKDHNLFVLGVPVVPRLEFLLKTNRFRGALSVAHTNFFTKKTLELTALWAGWKIENARSFYLKNEFLDKILNPISPHITLVLKNNKDFSYHEKKLKEWRGEDYYDKLIDYVSDSEILEKYGYNLFV